MTPTNNTTQHAKSLPQNLRGLLNEPLDVKLHLLQHHMELARLLVQEIRRRHEEGRGSLQARQAL